MRETLGGGGVCVCGYYCGCGRGCGRGRGRELRDAEEVFARLSVAVSAMEARRSELDNLVKLYCAGYFSTPANGAERKNVNERVSDDIRKNLNK